MRALRLPGIEVILRGIRQSLVVAGLEANAALDVVGESPGVVLLDRQVAYVLNLNPRV